MRGEVMTKYYLSQARTQYFTLEVEAGSEEEALKIAQTSNDWDPDLNDCESQIEIVQDWKN